MVFSWVRTALVHCPPEYVWTSQEANYLALVPFWRNLNWWEKEREKRGKKEETQSIDLSSICSQADSQWMNEYSNSATHFREHCPRPSQKGRPRERPGVRRMPTVVRWRSDRLEIRELESSLSKASQREREKLMELNVLLPNKWSVWVPRATPSVWSLGVTGDFQVGELPWESLMKSICVVCPFSWAKKKSTSDEFLSASAWLPSSNMLSDLA